MAAHEKPADPQPKKSLDAKLEEWPDERFWQEFNEFSIGTKWLETLKQVATRVIRPMYDRGLPPLRSSMLRSGPPRFPLIPPSQWEVFFCPLRFSTTSARRHLEKSRREKSCARFFARGGADFYQRFFR